MDVCSTLSHKVCLKAVFGVSSFILEILNMSLLFSKNGWNSLASFFDYHFKTDSHLAKKAALFALLKAL